MSDQHDIVVNHHFETRFVRALGNSFYAAPLIVTSTLIPMSEDVGAEQVHAIMRRIKHWTTSVLPRVVAFSRSNAEITAALFDENGLPRTSNLPMVTPGEPDDALLAKVFQQKLTALTDGKFEFVAVEVNSQSDAGLTFSYCGEESDLPSLADWVGVPYFFDKPWWARCDGSTFDMARSAEDDYSTIPEWSMPLDFLEPRAPSVVAFKPTIIEGTTPRKRRKK